MGVGTGASYAGYTGDTAQYYESNKAQWTLESSVWPISVLNLELFYMNGERVAKLTTQNVICRLGTDACYADYTAWTKFKIDVNAFADWQWKVTGIKPVFVNLYERLFKQPSL